LEAGREQYIISVHGTSAVRTNRHSRYLSSLPKPQSGAGVGAYAPTLAVGAFETGAVGGVAAATAGEPTSTISTIILPFITRTCIVSITLTPFPAGLPPT